MHSINSVQADPARMRVLGSGSFDSPVLRQHTCLRCANTWWPRRPTKPRRCARCKSPYWDRPRQVRSTPAPRVAALSPAVFEDALCREMAKAFGTDHPEAVALADRSLAKALKVLKDMKAAGRTWHEMAERMKREFGATLEKDQLKALVR